MPRLLLGRPEFLPAPYRAGPSCWSWSPTARRGALSDTLELGYPWPSGCLQTHVAPEGPAAPCRMMASCPTPRAGISQVIPLSPASSPTPAPQSDEKPAEPHD